MLVFFIGLIVAIVLMKKHPKVNMFAICGFLTLSLTTILYLALNYYFSTKNWNNFKDLELYHHISGIILIEKY